MNWHGLTRQEVSEVTENTQQILWRLASDIFIWLYEYLTSNGMSDAADRFESAIEEVSGLTRVREPVGYTNLRVFSGELGKTNSRQAELRTLSSDNLNTSLEKEFLATARSWRKVATHPNVVELIDWGDEPDPWLLVADEYQVRLVEHGGELLPSDVSEIVSATAEALRNAGLYNVSHFNLRPEYIRLSEDNSAVEVDDWGLERNLLECQTKTHITAYTAPEQLDASFGSQDKRTDVYGLAGLAYFALTGTHPLTARMGSVLEESPTPPSELTDNIPEGLDEFLLNSLAKDPNSRPDTPHSFAILFQQAIDPTRNPPVVGKTTDTREPNTQANKNDVQYHDTRNTKSPMPNQPDNSSKYNRRTIFRFGGLLLALAAVGIVSSRYLFSDSADGILDSVPPGMDFVSYTDVIELFSGEMVEQNLSQELSVLVDSDDEKTVNGLIKHMFPELRLDFKKIHNIVAFGQMTESTSQYFGLIIQSGWNAGTVSSALKQARVSLKKSEYMETSLYRISSDRLPWTVFLSFLQDGEFVVGTRTEVEDVIDQYASSGNTSDGDARQAFQLASQEPIRFGFEVSEDMMPEVNMEYDPVQAVENLSFGYGSIEKTPRLPLTLTFRAVSDSAANELENQLNALILVLHDRGDQFLSTQRDIQQVVEKIEIQKEGQEIYINVPNGLELLSIGLAAGN